MTPTTSQPHDSASASERSRPVNLHRTFVCGVCGRQIAGCNCPTAELEVIDSCTVCKHTAVRQ